MSVLRHEVTLFLVLRLLQLAAALQPIPQVTFVSFCFLNILF